MEEVLNAMRFWLDMGVDGLRLDAIPYLIERDGTSCENVPETHVKIKEIRAAIDAEYENRLILAEANMWPADVRPYFGDGDECHMAFHFPLMPRIYMALRQEDRLPITDIMAQTPDIPDADCQWGIFLRNHDELTLEMVTDDERDYMNLAYAADPPHAHQRWHPPPPRAARWTTTARRIRAAQLACCFQHARHAHHVLRRRNRHGRQHLSRRPQRRPHPHAVELRPQRRLQPLRPRRLYFPVIMDPIYGYQVVNVEAQQADQSSLLHWTRNMIALRKLFQVFGRGTLTFLHPENRKVLAYIRDLKRDDDTHETVLCVANLSRFAQPVSLDLTGYNGLLPVEMLGYVPLPPITAAPYPLTVAPYSFLWFELQPAPMPITEPTLPPAHHEASEQVALDLLTKGWSGMLAGHGLALLQQTLPTWLPNQRWFGAKSKPIHSVSVVEWVDLAPPQQAISITATTQPASTLGEVLLFLDVQYVDQTSDRYQLPLAYTTGPGVESLRANSPQTIIATLSTPTGPAILHDATTREDLRQSLLHLVASGSTLPVHTPAGAATEIAATIVAAHESRPAHEVETDAPATQAIAQAIAHDHSIEPADVAPQFTGHMPGAPATSIAAGQAPEASPASQPGSLTGSHSAAYTPTTAPLASRLSAAEQSNTNFLFGDKLLMKLFRRLEPGLNPDVEIGRFLTEVAAFPRVAPYLGALTLHPQTGEPTTVALLQGLVVNEGDGWSWTLAELARFFESVAAAPAPTDESRSASFLAQTPVSRQLAEHAALYLQSAALLGQRTAELHLALATPTDDPAFAAEPFTPADLQADARRIDAQINSTLDALKLKIATLKDLVADDAATVLTRRIQLFAAAHAITDKPISSSRIRIHGDYHLGQILNAKGDFVILDFEGEPARTLEQRRRKQSPLKDVAGMLRSFSYAAFSALDLYLQRHPQPDPTRVASLESWARLWQNTVSSEFLRAYRATLKANPNLLPPPAEAQALLNAYLLEKALYELLYELNNRPTWVRIPLAGILSLS